MRPPFRWDEERRFEIRAELDAAYFHLYEVERDDVEFIMDTFPIVKRKDEQLYGAFRTKELILDVYDAMAEAIANRRALPDDPRPATRTRAAPRLNEHLKGDDLADGQVRYCADRVGDAATMLRDAQVLDAVAPGHGCELASASEPTAYEDERHCSGSNRWETAFHFHSRDAATVGWMTKRRRLGDHRGWHRGLG